MIFHAVLAGNGLQHVRSSRFELQGSMGLPSVGGRVVGGCVGHFFLSDKHSLISQTHTERPFVVAPDIVVSSL